MEKGQPGAEQGISSLVARNARETELLRGSSQLRPVFRVRDGVALIVSNVIGVGIFVTPAVIAKLVPSPAAMLALWIAGGCLALAGAMSYAQLGRRWPEAGGEYNYLSKAYGPTAGFLSGWISLIAGFSGAVAASAVGLIAYLGQYFPSLSSERTFASLHLFVATITLSPQSITAATIIILFALLHACSLGAGKLTQNSLAMLIFGTVVLFCILGFLVGTGSWSHLQSTGQPFQPTSWLLALIPVMFTYSGWNAASYISEEMYDTKRTIGPALMIGTLAIVALYTLLNTLYLYAVPVEKMKNAINIGDAAASALFGVGRNFVTPILIVALLGAISAMTIAGPRVYFAMSRDGAFFQAFGRTSTRFGTPTFAICLQALWSIVLVMVGGFEQILLYTGFALVLSSGAAVAGLVFAQRRDLRTNPRLLLKMAIPGIFIIASTAMVFNAIVQAPKTSLIGVLLIGAGLPVFYFSKNFRSPSK
jgi:basic amino acid/polyamine antiporter, APA family